MVIAAPGQIVALAPDVLEATSPEEAMAPLTASKR
jgi:hypothetical protein